MLILQAGSAVAMRQNSKLVSYAALFLLIVILILIIRYVIVRFSTFLKNTANKKPQKKLDVTAVKNAALRLGLLKEEIAFLISECRLCNIQDLPLIAETDQCIQGAFKTLYRHICSQQTKTNYAEIEDKKLLLFSIIHKLENGKRSLTMITNSIAFEPGLSVSYTDNDGNSCPIKIIENTPVEMILSIAQKSDGTYLKPPPLTKIPLTVQLKNGIAYFFEPRIVRYQQRRDFEEMVVTHTKNIRPMLQRRFKRIPVEMRCIFREAKIMQQNGVKHYIPLQHSHLGMITDISAGGCQLRSMTAVPENQYIQLELELSEKEIDSVIGIVLKSKKDADIKSMVAHIRFVRMTKKTRNTVFALVYNYL